jgi:hypothetical protein
MPGTCSAAAAAHLQNRQGEQADLHDHQEEGPPLQDMQARSSARADLHQSAASEENAGCGPQSITAAAAAAAAEPTSAPPTSAAMQMNRRCHYSDSESLNTVESSILTCSNKSPIAKGFSICGSSAK